MLTRVEEIKLIARCAIADDRDAFGQLVEAYRPGIIRFFMHLTIGDNALSDDLAQETFIKAYLSIRSFKGLARFGTWLYRIAYNEYYKWLRQRHEDPLDDATPDISTDADNDSQIDLHRALQSLTEPQRIVITLFYIDDLPIKKIADITDMPTGTIKSHLSRAKSRLAELLKKDEIK